MRRGWRRRKKVIAHYADDAQAHHLAGLGLFYLNRGAEALRHYDRALALYTNPENLAMAREQHKQILEFMASEEQQ